MPNKGRVLITGGLGYIGSHTAVSLVQSGYDVILIDNLSIGSTLILDRIQKIVGGEVPFHNMDMTDYEALRGVMKQYKDIIGIMHFAAYISVEESLIDPLTYYHNNVVSTLNALRIMQECAIHHIIYSSSCTVYGQPDILPVTESTPTIRGVTPYGNSKKIGEEILEDVVRASDGLKAISLRYFNPIGAHESGLIGELPIGLPHHLVPFMTQAVAGKRPHLRVFGDDFPTPDGTAIRDYIHVMDVADAHVKAMHRIQTGAADDKYEMFNVGLGEGVSVLQVIQAFERSTQLTVPYKVYDRRPGDIAMIYADCSLIEKKMAWKAAYSLEEMTSSAWRWQQEMLSSGLMT